MILLAKQGTTGTVSNIFVILKSMMVRSSGDDLQFDLHFDLIICSPISKIPGKHVKVSRNT